MKFIIIAMALLIAGSASPAQTTPATAPETITEFHWDGADIEPFVNKFSWTGSLRGTYQHPSMAVEWHDKGPVSQMLRTLGSDIVSHVTSTHYAIIGRLKYTNVSSGSYLEMLSYFAPDKEGGPEQMYFSKTLADSGPMAKLEGTDEGRDFLLPFDATAAKTKLVQYPDAPVVTSQVASPSGEQVIMEFTQENASQGVAPTDGELSGLGISSSPMPLWDIKDPKIAATHYAVVGEIRYEDVSKGELQMWSRFAPEDPGGLASDFYTRTEAEEGPLGRLKGSSDWRPFWLPFDSSKIKTRLTRIGLSLSLADQGKVYVRNVKLVQYPNGIFPVSLAPSGRIPPPQLPSGDSAFQEQNPSAQVPVVAPKESAGIDWKSFVLGVAATGVSLLACGGIIFISRRWNRRRHERELRRIASLDS